MAFLTIERDGAILTVTMNQPETRNALTGNTAVEEFEKLCDDVRRDPSVKVIILTGEGDPDGEIVLLVVPSPAEIAALRAEVANLEARGGKAALTVCGDKKRLCAEIDTSAPEYGERGQFRILKGY